MNISFGAISLSGVTGAAAGGFFLGPFGALAGACTGVIVPTALTIADFGNKTKEGVEIATYSVQKITEIFLKVTVSLLLFVGCSFISSWECEKMRQNPTLLLQASCYLPTTLYYGSIGAFIFFAVDSVVWACR